MGTNLIKFQFWKVTISLPALLLLITLLISVSSCQKDEEAFNRIKRSETENKVLKYIQDLGFKNSDVKDMGSYYLVEEDIMFPKTMVVPPNDKSKAAKTSQWGTGSYISPNISNVVIYIDPSMSSFTSEISSAITQWNNVPNCRLSFSTTTDSTVTRHITMTSADLGSSTCGTATWPWNGNPGYLIRIHTNLISGNSFAQKQRTIAHEIGHTIGLRHSNLQQRGEPAGIYIEGTPQTDSNSLMNGGQCNSGATTLSFYDKYAFYYLYYTCPLPNPTGIRLVNDTPRPIYENGYPYSFECVEVDPVMHATSYEWYDEAFTLLATTSVPNTCIYRSCAYGSGFGGIYVRALTPCGYTDYDSVHFGYTCP